MILADSEHQCTAPTVLNCHVLICQEVMSVTAACQSAKDQLQLELKQLENKNKTLLHEIQEWNHQRKEISMHLKDLKADQQSIEEQKHEYGTQFQQKLDLLSEDKQHISHNLQELQAFKDSSNEKELQDAKNQLSSLAVRKDTIESECSSIKESVMSV